VYLIPLYYSILFNYQAKGKGKKYATYPGANHPAEFSTEIGGEGL